MRVSCLEPDLVRAARSALKTPGSDWESLFTTGFAAPPAPGGVPEDQWPHIAEHVARAERVSSVVREQGIEPAIAAFGRSPHAVEVATVIAAASQVDSVDLGLLEALLTAEIDELVAYGEFLTILVSFGAEDRVLDLYERFCANASSKQSDLVMWSDRVDAVRDGLASFYVACGHVQRAQELFEERHAEQQGDLVVALSASRAFLASGIVGRAVHWLGLGADRADELGREEMARTLRQKQVNLRKRMS